MVIDRLGPWVPDPRYPQTAPPWRIVSGDGTNPFPDGLPWGPIPNTEPGQPIDGWPDPPEPRIPTPDEVERIIELYRKMTQGAAELDAIISGEPDCVDPEKERLRERVDKLERILDDIYTKSSEA
jgi:hypothetical protein